jgi:MoxR-like ATPase
MAELKSKLEALEETYIERAWIEGLVKEISKIIVGQSYMIERLLIGLLGSGHILLEGLPGLAKTLAVKTLAGAVNGTFSRIQFTPDLLPADVAGTMIYNIQAHEFSVKKGPVFANFVLADEINRAPEKVQSALLEAMQEKQVTIGDHTFLLEEPFLVLATQNPVEQGGTYPLPEAQLDRFMMKVIVGYPSLEEERQILRQDHWGKKDVEPIISAAQILKAREVIKAVYLDTKIEDYILQIIFCTRFPESYQLSKLKPFIRFGASPRGSINLVTAAKVYAFLQNRMYVVPDDVRIIALDVLRHRVGLTYEAENENIKADEIIREILRTVPAP